MDNNNSLKLKLEVKIGIIWVDRLFYLEKNEYKLVKENKNKIFTGFNETSFNLKNAKIKEDKDDPLIIKVYHSEDKNIFRFKNINDKAKLIQEVNKVINEIAKKNAFSKEYQENEDEYEGPIQISNQINKFQNLLKELTNNINKLNNFVEKGKVKSFDNKDEAITIAKSLSIINTEITKQFNSLANNLSNMTKNPQQNEEGDNGNEFFSCDSEEGEDDKPKPTQIKVDCQNSNTLKNGESNLIRTFTNTNYSLNNNSIYHSHQPRTHLKKKIKFETNVLNDLTSIFSKNKFSLPIYYHEPITFLQRQCEMFIYNDLLSIASTIEDKPLQMCYIGAFLIASLSLNINRNLKPFEPLLGETFEYFDPNNQYRYFAEKVCKEPKISAFIGESDSWVFYGDNRNKTKYKLLKGFQLEFLSKYHLLFKKTNNEYTISKPLFLILGGVVGEIRIDFSGISVIEDVHDKNLRLEIEFFENKKGKQLGSLEGKVTNNGNTVYLLKGNWNSYVNYCDPEGGKVVNIWKIIEDKYLEYKEGEYNIPSYSYNLNYINDEMESVLPPTDSRLRPDIREYEEGDNDLAASIKAKIDKNEKEKFLKMDKENTLYQPNYFNEVFDQNTGEYVYVYQGGYWEDREKRNYSHLNADLFKYDDKEK